MAFAIKGELTGLDDVLRNLQGVKRSVRNRALRTAITKVSRRMAAAAKAKVEKRTGLLKKSLGFKVRTYKNRSVVAGVIGPKTGMKQTVTLPDGTTEVEDPSKIAHFVEKGRQAVSIKTARVLSNGTVFFGRHVRAVPARPFLRPAFDAAKGYALGIIREEVAKAVAKGRE